MLMSLFTKLLDSIPYNAMWETIPNGFRVYKISEYTDTSNILSFTNEDMAAIDNRLPAAIRLMITRDPIVLKSEITGLILAWDCPIKVVSGSGATIALSIVRDIKVTESQLVLTGLGLVLEEVQDMESGETVILNKGTVTEFLSDFSWFDEHYSGWKNRLELAQSLALNAQETIEWILDARQTNLNTCLPLNLEQ